MNKELIESLNVLEKEKEISKEVLFEAIENSLVVAYKNNFNKADNVIVNVDRETGDFHIYSQKEVVEEVFDPVIEISLEDARAIKGTYEIGDTQTKLICGTVLINERGVRSTPRSTWCAQNWREI